MTSPRRLVVLVLLLSSTTAVRAGVDRWTPLSSPLGAPVSAVTFDPERPRTLYLVSGPSYRQELWKSYNGGATWSLLREGLDPGLQGGWGLQGPVFDPADSRRLWVWSAYAVWFSADGGLRWVLRHGASGGLGRFTQLLPDPARPERLLAGGETEIRVSDDGGASWAVLGPLPEVMLEPRLHADPADPLLFHLSSERGLFRSADGGRSWSRVTPFQDGGFLELVIAPSRRDVFYAIRNAAPDQLQRSTDGGASWQATNLPGPRFHAFNPLVDPRDADRVRVVVQRAEGQFLLSSEDGGETWSDEALAIPGARIVLGPGDPPTLFSIPGLQRSDDGGRTWRRLGRDVQAGGVFSLSLAAWGGRRAFYATASDGTATHLLRSRDDGASWQDLGTPGLHRVAADPWRSGRLFGLGNGVLRSDDGGARWRRVSPGALSQATSLFVDPTRAGRLFVGTMFAGVWRSEDAGGTWLQSVRGIPVEDDCTRFSCPFVGPFAVDAEDRQRIYVVVDGGLYRSADGGATWRFAGRDLPDSGAVAAHPARSGVVYAGTSEGVFESRDGGGRWQRWASLRGSVRHLLVDPATEHLYASTDAGPFRRSVAALPADLSWQDLGAGLPALERTLAELVADPVSPGRVYGVLPSSGVWTGRFVGAEALHLPTGRFELRAAFAGESGLHDGVPLRLSSEGGSFAAAYCGASQLLVKLLHGGDPEGAFWLFAGGLTLDEVELTVFDRLSGVARTYLMPPRPRAFADLESFPAAPFSRPTEPATEAATATPARARCTFPEVALGQRFCAAVRWQDDGEWRSAEGGAVPACFGRLPQSATFWFARPSLPELGVRVVLGRGGWTVYHTALTDRAWELEVTDPATGARRLYSGAGKPTSGVDADAFPPL